MICQGCGDPLDEDDELTPDGKRHESCICTCHERGCRNDCAEEECQMIHISSEPCKGQCGCYLCMRMYQDFLSME